jgi:uncharacterized protein (UPF0261 family)
VPGGLFWDPAADTAFMEAVRSNLRPGIELSTHDLHVNDAAFATLTAEKFVQLMRGHAPRG